MCGKNFDGSDRRQAGTDRKVAVKKKIQSAQLNTRLGKFMYYANRIIEPFRSRLGISALPGYIRCFRKVCSAESENIFIVSGYKQCGSHCNGAGHYHSAIIVDMLPNKVYPPGAKKDMLCRFVKFLLKF